VYLRELLLTGGRGRGEEGTAKGRERKGRGGGGRDFIWPLIAYGPAKP